MRVNKKNAINKTGKEKPSIFAIATDNMHNRHLI